MRQGAEVDLGGLRVGILGSLLIEVEDRRIDIGAPKQRALFALLAIQAGHPVGVEQLIDGLWGDRPPRSAQKTLQTYVSGLRRLLPDGTLVTVANGYQLVLDPEQLDANRFERLIGACRVEIMNGELAAAKATLIDALQIWRGPALADVLGELSGMSAAQRFDELRSVGLEDLAELRLRLGEHQGLIADLEAAATAEPLRERRWAQLMTALYRSGRQADALRAFGRLREGLAEELGIEPSAELVQLERSVLLQDASLDWVAEPGTGIEGTGRRNDLGAEPVFAEDLLRTVGPDGELTGGGRLVLPDGNTLDIPAHGLRIGRANDNDLVLDDARASRHHASIVCRSSQFIIADLHSTNGTQVGAKSIEGGYGLSPGDQITVGDTLMIFITSDASVSPDRG
jgi:DNA-binding SARP family transcriptional activator